MRNEKQAKTEKNYDLGGKKNKKGKKDNKET